MWAFKAGGSSSLELSLNWLTNAHEVKKMWNSEMKFMLIPIYELHRDVQKIQDRTIEFDPGSD